MKHNNKAMLSIFYGRRVLRRAKMVPDKKKRLTFKHFFIFSFDILKSFFYQIGRFSITLLATSPENKPNSPTTASE